VVVVFMELEELSEERFSCTGGGVSTVELEELVEERCSSINCAIRRGWLMLDTAKAGELFGLPMGSALR
jgi:hypothetical protein